MQARLLSFVAITSLLSACAHGSGSKASSEPSKEPAPSSAAAPKTKARPVGLRSPDRTAQRAALGAYMPEHFQIVTWARDSIINGELDLMREPLRALANHTYEDLAPAAWMHGIGRLQQVAAIAAETTAVTQASQAVAAMARECGRCHEEMAPEPVLDALRPLPAQPPGETWDDRMLRHGWALDRMWEGIVLPSERVWVVGANALAQAPARAPETEPRLSPEIQATLEELRQLGAQAAGSESWEARTKVYGRMLATCARCHAPDETSNL